MSFAHLLESGRIGGLELSNRIVLPAMDMNLCDDGVITDGEVAHYTARAAGGAALVITGSGAVAFPRGATSRHQPGLSDDRFVAGLTRLADSVHDVGGKLCIQLCHHGKVAGVDTADGRPLLVPSTPVPGFAFDALADNPASELMRLASATQGKSPTYRAADEDDLAWVVGQFAEAAVRAQLAGADAVEIHAAHGYLLSTFLSNAYNHRTDRWGGGAENRSRLTCDVVRAVRQEVGAGFPIIVRINGQEFGIEGAIDPTDAAELATCIAGAGADAIHVSANAHNPFADFTDGPLPSAVGRYREFARTVKQAVDIPVIAVGRVLPELAEEMIVNGDCDFVSMGRQQLADPELVNKLASGRRSEIRPCINCYVCVEQNFFDSPPRCAVNPALGDESRSSRVTTQTASPRRFAVVGGGPAGMEFARLAARRGHHVTLLERSSSLGGTMRLAQLTTPPLAPLLEWLQRDVIVAGVTVLLDTVATPEVLRTMTPDVVVVAGGAHRGLPDVPGADLANVNTATSKPLTSMGQHVVVIGGGLVGLGVAQHLADADRTVTVLEAGPHLGLPMAMPRRWAAVRSAAACGVHVHRNAVVEAIDNQAVTYRVGDELHTVAADDVIVTSDVTADATLSAELAAAGFDVRTIGDANDVGFVDGAIRSAWNLVEEL